MMRGVESVVIMVEASVAMDSHVYVHQPKRVRNEIIQEDRCG